MSGTKRMHRWMWYTAGFCLAPTKLASALIVGLTVADVAYSAQKALFETGTWVALGTAAVVFKTAAVAVYFTN